ncbi:MAG: RdgB/HAM1 family non-canonical purine NTP pyrophosphatase [Bacteroidales bacterium]|nr:RdgB/HAM1 family non-canonical purine NTP pyrophosphatase [Bacteroidales bacterium]
MEKLVFATHNPHKLKELRQIFPSLEILGLHDCNITEEIIEDGHTLEANAEIKADYVFQKTGFSCFADDTGLEVDALHGAPGVLSARYAGDGHDFNANMDKLLREMKDKENRSARFKTVICLILNGRKSFFEGVVEGEILHQPRGDEGFGYDPIFRPLNHSLSFAEMTSDEKNSISHRGRAVQKLLGFLLKQLDI